MADARLSQLPVELLSSSAVSARLSQLCVELISSTTETVTLGHSLLISGQRNYAIGSGPT